MRMSPLLKKVILKSKHCSWSEFFSVLVKNTFSKVINKMNRCFFSYRHLYVMGLIFINTRRFQCFFFVMNVTFFYQCMSLSFTLLPFKILFFHALLYTSSDSYLSIIHYKSYSVIMSNEYIYILILNKWNILISFSKNMTIPQSCLLYSFVSVKSLRWNIKVNVTLLLFYNFQSSCNFVKLCEIYEILFNCINFELKMQAILKLTWAKQESLTFYLKVY